jgi:outer membrane protein TolC
MPKVRNAILICLCCLLPSVAAAADPPIPKVEKGVPLSLEGALVRGIEKNLDLKMVQVQVPASQEEVIIQEAQFDPSLDASASSGQDRLPNTSAAYWGDQQKLEANTATVGVSKRFETGLRSRVGVETSGVDTNLVTNEINPAYRTYLVLDLTQPLFKGAGTEANTANLRISQKQQKQTQYQFLNQAQALANQVERTYYLLSLAHVVLRHRIESRHLASGLLQGNREKFKAGVVPITEVQEAETAVAARDEQIVYAQQQMETVSNRLKDLLEIRAGDPMFHRTIRPQELTDPDQPYPDLTQAMSVALKHRPDLLRQKVELEKLDIRLAYLDNQRLPQIDLAASLAMNGLAGTETEAGTLTGNPYGGSYGDSWNSLADGDGYNWFVGLRLTYPLGNREADSRYRVAGWGRKRALYQLKRLEGTTETELKNALVTLRRSLERVRVAERFQNLAETNLRQEMRRLDEGLSDSFRILDFQNNVIEARIRKAVALADFNQGLANLHMAMGDNLTRFKIIPKMNPEDKVDVH